MTQRTLSAFHRAGIDASLTEEIDELKKVIRGKKKLVLVDATTTDGVWYTRRFLDGSTDVVEKSHIFENKYETNSVKELHLVERAFEQEMSPISKMVSMNHVDRLCCERRKIKRPSECIMFMN